MLTDSELTFLVSESDHESFLLESDNPGKFATRTVFGVVGHGKLFNFCPFVEESQDNFVFYTCYAQPWG